MNPSKKLLLITSSFLVFDSLWLGVISQGFYFENLRHLVRTQGDQFDVHYGAAGVVYLCLVINFYFFVAQKVEESASLKACLWAFIAGASVYGVYDFTNMATLRDWPLIVSLTDTVWGGVLYVLTALVYKRAITSVWFQK